MKYVHYLFAARIRDGSEAAVRRLSESMISDHLGEPGTIGYSWYISEDGRQLRVHEEFIDSNCMLKHVEAASDGRYPELEKHLENIQIAVFGDPTGDARQRLLDAGADIFPYVAGFNRLSDLD